MKTEKLKKFTRASAKVEQEGGMMEVEQGGGSKVKIEDGGFAMKVEEGGGVRTATQVKLVDGDGDFMMKVEESIEVKTEARAKIEAQDYPVQRASSRLKKKNVPDWSFLRGKKRAVDASSSDIDAAGRTKRARTRVRKGEEEHSTRDKHVKREHSPQPVPSPSGQREIVTAGASPSSEKSEALLKTEPFEESKPAPNTKAPGSRSGKESKPKAEDAAVHASVKIEPADGKMMKSNRQAGSARTSRQRGVKVEHISDSVPPVIKEEEVKPKVKEKVKKKKGNKERDLTLVLDVRSRYLAAGVPSLPFAIPDYSDSIHGVKVPRMFISNTYGGSTQETFPRIKPQKLAIHGYDSFIFLGDDLHPLAPQVPGAPGMWVNVAQGRSEWDGGILRVFVRTKGNHSPPLWWYMGQYELRGTLALTREEWSAQTVQVKNTWAESVVRYGWGSRMRASILARRVLGREASDDEIDDYEASKAYQSIDAANVALALTRGDERLNLFTMKCVAYDDGFQRDIARKYPPWLQVHPPKR